MLNPEKKEKTRSEELREAILNAPESIEEEFTRTANSWLACFGSSVFVVETYLFSPKVRALLSSEEYSRAEKNIENLKLRLFELKKIYPDKNTIPPDEIKQELLDKLDILQE